MTALVARTAGFALFSLAAASLAVSAEPAPASSETAQKHLLQYKFAMGETLRYKVRHATNVRTTIESSTQQAETDSDSVKAWKVTDVLPNGEMEFIHVVEQVRMSNQAPERPANKFDSSSKEKPPRGFEHVARAIGVPLSLVRISSSGAIVHREEKHPQPPVSPDMPITLQLPEEAIAVGDKWNHPYDVPAERKSGAKLQVRTRRVCQLREVKTGVALIDVEYQILTPVDSYVRSQLIERLTKGMVRFDLERGRVIEQEHNVDARVLGFAGKASSMHFVARLQENLLPPTQTDPSVKQASAQQSR